ncbi:MAG: hypothetical protein ACXV3C_13960, partial [Actinomycetes bacterium]
DSGGSGLGLAIVRQLVQSIGGAVHLEDAAPGLRAVVQLPLASGSPGRVAASRSRNVPGR